MTEKVSEEVQSIIDDIGCATRSGWSKMDQDIVVRLVNQFSLMGVSILLRNWLAKEAKTHEEKEMIIDRILDVWRQSAEEEATEQIRDRDGTSDQVSYAMNAVLGNDVMPTNESIRRKMGGLITNIENMLRQSLLLKEDRGSSSKEEV